jgi:hypothetical protein
MGYGSSAKFCKGKRQKGGGGRRVAKETETLPGDLPDLPEEEPPLAAPARKRSRSSEPCRKSRRGEPEPWKPTPRGPPAAKPQRAPIGEQPPEEAEARRSANRRYAKTAWQKKKDAAFAELPEADADASVYAVTKTGKLRKSKKAERDAKFRDTSAIVIPASHPIRLYCTVLLPPLLARSTGRARNAHTRTDDKCIYLSDLSTN